MRTCLAAFTPPGSNYPPYISINFEDDTVEISVRSPVKEDGRCGDFASIQMSVVEFNRLLEGAAARLADQP